MNRHGVPARSRWAILAALVLGAGLAPTGAPAYDGIGCFGSWNTGSTYTPTGVGQCSVTFTGTPIHISGEASAASSGGAVEIRVWVHPQGYPELILAECHASGTGGTSCGAEFTPLVADASLPQTPPGTRLPLQCNWSWRGNRAGSAGCFVPANCDLGNLVGATRCVSILGEPVDP